MVLVLCLMPCTDLDLSSDEDKIEISSTDNTAKHTLDICSPFCQCSCCTSPTLTLFNTFTIKSPQGPDRLYGKHLPGKVIESMFAVWQPPRLS